WIVSGGEPITGAHLPQDVRHPYPGAGPAPPGGLASSARSDPATVPFPSPAGYAGGGQAKSLADVEMEYILQVYAKNGQNKQATATELGISLKTLYNKLHKYEEERRMRAG